MSLAHFQEQVTEEAKGIWSNLMRCHEVSWYSMLGALKMHQKSMAWRKMEQQASQSGV